MSNANTHIDQAFRSLTTRDQQLLQRWAVQPDPFKPNYSIRLTTLAVEFNLSQRQVERVLTNIRKKYPELYEHLNRIRKHERMLRKSNHLETIEMLTQITSQAHEKAPPRPRQPFFKRAIDALRGGAR